MSVCTCSMAGPDADGNYDLIENPNCPRHGRGTRMTTYVVLLESDNAGNVPSATTFAVADRLEAATAEAACRDVASGMSDADLENGAVLYAVPARSWKPTTIRAQTQRRLLVS